jgi:cytochrome c553
MSTSVASCLGQLNTGHVVGKSTRAVHSLLTIACMLPGLLPSVPRYGERTASRCGRTLWTTIIVALAITTSNATQSRAQVGTALETERLIDQGRYLTAIGVCEACHTPPAVSDNPPSSSDVTKLEQERRFRTNPDRFRYLDPTRRMAGGVAFILRFSATSSGVVITPNITPDVTTGLGAWSEAEIAEVLRSGKRKDGTYLFMFPPHSYYPNLAEQDIMAIATYLKSLTPVSHRTDARRLPFPVGPSAAGHPPVQPPEGRSIQRAQYLIDGLVGCRECHSHNSSPGHLEPFTGGDPVDATIGVFRLGPDLPLRQSDKGFAAWPYPGYAVLYGPNLTRYGLGGDLSWVSAKTIVRSIRTGISPIPDDYGRPDPLEHVMMWQFYSQMSDPDAFSIADYIKSLRYVPHSTGDQLFLFGDDWEAAFTKVFGEPPSSNDREIYGKGK